MSKLEFISRLRQSLSDLPEEEIERALEYYEDYFDDSPKTDEEVASSLALPEEIAENIKKEILGKPEGKTEAPEAGEGVFTERGFETPQDRQNYQEVDKFTKIIPNQQAQEEGREGQQEQKEEKGQYRYDERKERKKHSHIIFKLLLIFGCIWVAILLLIAAAMVLYSFEKNSAEEETEQEVKIVSEIEDTKANETSSMLSDSAEFVPNQNIKSLKIDFAVGKVKLCEGDQFSARITKNKSGVSIKSEVKNGTWKLKEEDNENIWDNLKHILKRSAGVSITITVPKGFEAEEFDVEINAGTLSAGSLTGKKVDFEVDTGSIKVKKLIAEKEADMEANMGSITISSGNIRNLDLACDMGTVSYTGILTGTSKIACDMGSVNMTLTNKAENYTFSAQNSMGKININGKSYRGFDSEVTEGNGSSKVKLTVDMGTIKVTTEE